MSQFHFPRHVYFCFTEDAAVFLDLRNDRYSGLPYEHVRALRTVMPFLRLPEWLNVSDTASGLDAEEIALALAGEGLLTEDLHLAKDAVPTATSAPTSAACDDDLETQAPAIRLQDLLNFVLSWIFTKLRLRWRSLEICVEHHRKRKAQVRASPGLAGNSDRDIRACVWIYRRLRPWFFSAKDQCLLDSLVLASFMHRYGLHPALIFGVQTGPFGAHCWLQQDGLVLNSTLERVRAFTPILVA